MSAQAPSIPAPFLAALQAWQMPVHSESQQKPSTQLPLVHCEADEQPWPKLKSGWQVASDARQKSLPMHCESSTHVVAQALLPHVYGMHGVLVAP